MWIQFILIGLLSVLAFTEAEVSYPDDVSYEINATDTGPYTCEKLINMTVTTQNALNKDIVIYGANHYKHFRFNCTDYKNQTESFMNNTGSPFIVEVMKTKMNTTWDCTIWIDRPTNDSADYCFVTVNIHPKLNPIAVYICFGLSCLVLVIALGFTIILTQRKNKPKKMNTLDRAKEALDDN